MALPDTNVTKSRVALAPRWSSHVCLFNYDRFLSDDGQLYFGKTWLEGTDIDGGTLRQVGAVLWNCTTGDWQTRGLTDDLRGWPPTEKVSCDPPYFYAMSNDGSALNAKLPTEELYVPGNGIPFIDFETLVEKKNPAADSPFVLPDVEIAASPVVNFDGSLILFYARKASN